MSDQELIKSLGGATELAKLLGYGPQRVHNWLERGIPAAEKLKRPDLFLPHLSRRRVPVRQAA